MNDLRWTRLASGVRIGYIEAGEPEGEPVILLHGFPECHWSYRFQWPALAAAGYRVIVPDQRGYNRTDKTPPYDLGTLTQDIAQLQDALGIARSHIAGHDWGGAVMWSFAARFPERVIKVIGLNAPHLNAYQDVLRRSWKQFWRSQYIAFFQLPRVSEWVFSRDNFQVLNAWTKQVKNGHMTLDDVQRYRDAMSQPGAMSAMLGWYRAAMREAIRSGFKMPEMKINHPTLLIWGEQDAFITKDVAEATRKYVPDLRIEYLPNATHWVQMDEPERVNELMLAFLRPRS